MASLPYNTEAEPIIISVFSIFIGDTEIILCILPPLYIALLSLTPSTDKTSLFVDKPLIIGLPPPN